MRTFLLTSIAFAMIARFVDTILRILREGGSSGKKSFFARDAMREEDMNAKRAKMEPINVAKGKRRKATTNLAASLRFVCVCVCVCVFLSFFVKNSIRLKKYLLSLFYAARARVHREVNDALFTSKHHAST